MAEYGKAVGGIEVLYWVCAWAMAFGVLLVYNSESRWLLAAGITVVLLGFSPALFAAVEQSDGVVDAPHLDDLLSTLQYAAFLSALLLVLDPLPIGSIAVDVEPEPLQGIYPAAALAVGLALAPVRYLNTRKLFQRPRATT